MSSVQISSMESLKSGFSSPKEAAKRERIFCWFLTNWWIAKSIFLYIGHRPLFMMTAVFLATNHDFLRISFHSAKKLSIDLGPWEKKKTNIFWLAGLLENNALVGQPATREPYQSLPVSNLLDSYSGS